LRDVAAVTKNERRFRGPRLRSGLPQFDFSAASSMTRRRRPMSITLSLPESDFSRGAQHSEQEFDRVIGSSDGSFVEKTRDTN